MNAVERAVHYTREDLIDQEPPHDIPERKPPTDWPSSGAIQFKDVVMSYRKGLPPVLKGITLDVKAGERIGVVGRTGAGKVCPGSDFCQKLPTKFCSVIPHGCPVPDCGTVWRLHRFGWNGHIDAWPARHPEQGRGSLILSGQSIR